LEAKHYCMSSFALVWQSVSPRRLVKLFLS
jgi:hypothetical protein